MKNVDTHKVRLLFEIIHEKKTDYRSRIRYLNYLNILF